MQQDERRRTPRYPFSAIAEILDQQEDHRIESRVRDLSSGGCYVETPDPLPLGKNVMLEIYTDNEFLETQASVAFHEAHQGMGLCFGVMQPHFAAVLQAWLSEAKNQYTH
jgi:PilZ domain-containing protein